MFTEFSRSLCKQIKEHFYYAKMQMQKKHRQVISQL